MTKPLDAMVLMMSDSYGVYIPQYVVADMAEGWQGIADDDRAIVMQGPEHDQYWDAWDSILNSAFYMDGGHRYTLHQDGDCWAICPERMTNEEYADFFGEMKPAPDNSYEYAVCSNCLIALANDDYSGMDDDEAKATDAGLTALHRQYRMVIADGAEYGFKHSSCECCDALAGDRYRVLCFNPIKGE